MAGVTGRAVGASPTKVLANSVMPLGPFQ